MIDHIGFAVRDAERSRLFYAAALAPLGITLVMSATPEQTEAGGTAHSFGTDGKPFLWVGDNEKVGEGTHVALATRTRGEVDAFYAAALAAGAATMARRACGRIMDRIITRRSCAIPTATISRRSAALPHEDLHDRL